MSGKGEHNDIEEIAQTAIKRKRGVKDVHESSLRGKRDAVLEMTADQCKKQDESYSRSPPISDVETELDLEKRRAPTNRHGEAVYRKQNLELKIDPRLRHKVVGWKKKRV